MSEISREEYLSKKPYFTKNNCPFCKENLLDREKLYETKYWIVLKNDYPYFKDYENHLIAMPKRHVEFTHDLNEEEYWDFKNIDLFMKDFYKSKNYFSFIRQTKWNKSVEHIHYHYLIWMPWEKVIDWNNCLKLKY